MPSSGNNWENDSATTMRVLVADQESDMLEAIARVFEVDVATSKVTCIDLLRANDFDVIVACERLTDGSGLELLSHVGQRWPNVVRILAIEPDRRAMLKGRLGPFKLFETIAYPIEEDKLEAALTRAAEAIARTEAMNMADESPAPRAPSSRDATSSGSHRAASPAGAASRGMPAQPAAPNPSRASNSTPQAAASRQPASRGVTSSASAAPSAPPSSRGYPTSRAAMPPPQVASSRVSEPSPAVTGRRPSGADQKGANYPPLPKNRQKIVPLGSPETQFRIVPHDYQAQHMPGTLPGKREDASKKTASLPGKAAALAADAVTAVSGLLRTIKTPAPPPPRTPPPTAPAPKKR